MSTTQPSPSRSQYAPTQPCPLGNLHVTTQLILSRSQQLNPIPGKHLGCLSFWNHLVFLIYSSHHIMSKRSPHSIIECQRACVGLSIPSQDVQEISHSIIKCSGECSGLSTPSQGVQEISPLYHRVFERMLWPIHPFIGCSRDILNPSQSVWENAMASLPIHRLSE